MHCPQITFYVFKERSHSHIKRCFLTNLPIHQEDYYEKTNIYQVIWWDEDFRMDKSILETEQQGITKNGVQDFADIADLNSIMSEGKKDSKQNKTTIIGTIQHVFTLA